MKDLDFDELDRAVNSLMTGPKDKPAAGDKTPGLSKPASPAPAPHVPPAPVVNPVPPSNTNVPMVPPKPAVSSVATRRSGRFMDVVHPSSDMKKPDEPKKPAPREGVTIHPPARENVPVPSPRPSTPPPAPKPMPTPAPQHEPVVPSVPDPDPLDVPAPLTTPFLADAKVEKRPLGAPVKDLEPPVKDEDDNDKKDLSDESNNQLPAQPADIHTPLPAELHGDLVAIESGAAKHTGAVPSSELEKTDAENPAKPATPLPSVAKSIHPLKPSDKPGAGSIPQQYHEQPSTGDKSTGAIFDTANYHKPLAHPGKKKSSWLIVVWIALVVLMGACAGVMLYYFRVL